MKLTEFNQERVGVQSVLDEVAGDIDDIVGIAVVITS